MSAFMVSEQTISTIAASIWSASLATQGVGIYLATEKFKDIENILDRYNEISESKLARELYKMNADAVNQRYGTADFENVPKIKSGLALMRYDKPAIIVKMLDCFLYQCTEGDVPDRPLYKAVELFRDSLCKYIVSRLPDYENAAWG